jgi:hypothetical protein
MQVPPNKWRESANPDRLELVLVVLGLLFFLAFVVAQWFF